MSRQDGVLRATETYGTHQTAKERLIVLRGLSRDKPGKLERAYSTQVLRRSKPSKLKRAYSTQVLKRSKPGKLLS